MAAKLLLPGLGGAYTSEAYTFSAGITAASRGTDTIDASHCGQMAVQIISQGTGTVQIETSTDLTNWANLGSAINVATTGTIALFDITDGPFNVIRINPGSISAGTGITVKIVGYPVQIRA